MDLQAALDTAAHFARLARCADRFGWSRERLIEELIEASENYKKIAAYLDTEMSQAI
jgi:branched-subunit amino acid aminotransferase/4-amino-4-deoxychorismate lyase